MAQPISPCEIISSRRREIEADMDRLRGQIGAMQTALEVYRAELKELEVADRVMARLQPENSRSGISESIQPDADIPISPAQPARKPTGTPTVPHMIIAALHQARRRGLAGLEPKDMTSYIASTWWPDAKVTDVGPIAWRMWKKQGVLVNEGGTYALAKAYGDLL